MYAYYFFQLKRDPISKGFKKEDDLRNREMMAARVSYFLKGVPFGVGLIKPPFRAALSRRRVMGSRPLPVRGR